MVKLLKAYGGYAKDAYVAFPDDTETALVAQGFAVASTVTVMPSIFGGPEQPLRMGGNDTDTGADGFTTPTYYQGPLRLPCINLGSAALTGYETNGVASIAGQIYMTEIFVPYKQTWTGAGILNGTTVGTDKAIVALYGTNGALLANSAVAGTTTAGASVFQNIAFTAPITLVPGRYFIAVQLNGTTDTLRHLLAANGSVACTSSTAGAFGTVPSTMTAPTTFTTAVGVITQLYV